MTPGRTTLGWLTEGARSLLFLRPRWERVACGPAVLLFLAALYMAIVIGSQRIETGTGAVFDPGGLSECLFLFLPVAWAAYAACSGRDCGPRAGQMATLLLSQLTLLAIVRPLHGALVLASQWSQDLSDTVLGLVWYIPVFWLLLAQAVPLGYAGASGLRRAAAIAALCAGVAAVILLDSGAWMWRAAGEEAEATPFTISQEALEEQLPLLDEQLTALKPQRPGVIDMYTITFAPYEGEEVFRRESELVAGVMAARFGAGGRGLQLINHRETMGKRPWATPLNLERAIDGVAEVMDVNEDILFIHLTSHGASDGELAAQFAPLDVAPLIPAALRKALDDAGIRYRVLSISACFSGSWIKPLAGDGTLVMTASDADHTSYGCGRKSDLTFFGRAMYDEQLRRRTLSFEEAHAAARPVILQRESDAGKDDGYSNPQIQTGAAIRAQLARQRARLSSSDR